MNKHGKKEQKRNQKNCTAQAPFISQGTRTQEHSKKRMKISFPKYMMFDLVSAPIPTGMPTRDKKLVWFIKTLNPMKTLSYR